MPRSTPARRRRASVLAASAAAAALALLSGGCGAGGLPEDGNVARGKQLFMEGQGGKQACSACHTLADAGSTGTIGPNLDEAFGPGRRQGFKESTIASIVYTQIKYPSNGQSTRRDQMMPANLVTGDDAEAVAAYVAACAGNEGSEECTGPERGGGQAAGGRTNDPKSIFTSAGCGGCHTFSDAGTTGTTAPNLDESRTSLPEAIQQIREGGGGMPAFKDQLSEAQIRALAEYITESRR